MAFVHGSNAVVKLNDGSTLQDLSSAGTTMTFDQSRDTAETTAFGDGSKAYIKGLKDATFSLEGTRDSTIQGYVQDAFDADAPTAFEYMPEGEGSGLPKLSGNCIITSVSNSSGVDDANKWSAEGQVTGDVTIADQA